MVDVMLGLLGMSRFLAALPPHRPPARPATAAASWCRAPAPGAARIPAAIVARSIHWAIARTDLPVTATIAGPRAHQGLFSPDAPPINLARTSFPPPLRPEAGLSVLDITKYFGEKTGGIRTYLLEKARYVEANPSLRQVLVVPGPEDTLTESRGVRAYRLRGPRIPTEEAYRFLLATRPLTGFWTTSGPTLSKSAVPSLSPGLPGARTVISRRRWCGSFTLICHA